MMIMYNTLMGVCAALVMLIAADALKQLHTTGEVTKLPSHALGLAITGVPLTVLGFLMTVTWPLEVNPAINIIFGEHTFMLGVLALGATFMLARGMNLATVDRRPIVWIIMAVGGMLAFSASSVFTYNLVGDAPSSEPITGQFAGWENTTWGLALAVTALGCVATFVYRPDRTWAYHLVRVPWIIGGAFFLGFSILNYRTHTGQLLNLVRGTDFNW